MRHVQQKYAADVANVMREPFEGRQMEDMKEGVSKCSRIKTQTSFETIIEKEITRKQVPFIEEINQAFKSTFIHYLHKYSLRFFH